MTQSLEKILTQSSKFQQIDFYPGIETKIALEQQVKILIVGAGGLGCEILKNTVLMGFKNIDIVDMDTIELTNLNRQFLFRKQDIGKYKAQVACQFVQKRIKGLNLNWYKEKIQDLLEKDPTFYNKYMAIIAGLDNEEARIWLNKLVHQMSKQGLNIPLIDGGTEGYLGQTRVIIPFQSTCYKCASRASPQQSNQIQLCTLGRPRIPAHCVYWAKEIAWNKIQPDREPNSDNHLDLQWIHATSQLRAQQFGLDTNWDLFDTIGMFKNIIPAIASTNAIIAAQCCNELFKIVTYCRPRIKNDYLFYNGNQGIFTHNYGPEKFDDCDICKS